MHTLIISIETVTLTLETGSHEQVDNTNPLRTQSTSCSSNTSDPRFDTEFFFPLSVETIDDILSGQVTITLTDTGPIQADAEEDSQINKGIDVGKVQIPFSKIFKGRALKNCIILKPAYHNLSKTKSMTRGSQGRIRMSLSFYMGEGMDYKTFGVGDFKEMYTEISRVISGSTRGREVVKTTKRSKSR